MNIYIRILFSLVTSGFVLYGFSLYQNPLAWSLLILILLLYLFMVWVRDTWWTQEKYGLFVCIVLMLAGLLRLLAGLTEGPLIRGVFDASPFD